MAGGGIKGGKRLGRAPRTACRWTAARSVPDLLATVCHAVGIDCEKQNMSNVGRPIRIVDKGGQPITEVLA